MRRRRSRQQEQTGTGQKFSRTIWNDLRWKDFRTTLHRDLKEAYLFYLSEEERGRLAGMGRVRRFFYLTIWVLKSLILRLTPARRTLLLAGLVFLLLGLKNLTPLFLLGSFVAVLLVLVLELKDKLLATDELAIGRAAQIALLPDRNPSLAGWEIWLYTRPANEVGGDLIDYMELPEKKLGVVLADVSGKGLGAALLMVKLQATMRALVPGPRSLAALGDEINRIFCRDTPLNRFATMVYLELEAESGRVRMLNAGHMPPFTVRLERVEKLPLGSPVLGVEQDAKYCEQAVELQENELLLVYSDGLSEARNEAGELFGETRLIVLLPELWELGAEEAGNRLLAEVDRFVGEARVHDDLSLIVLRRRP
jgi:sigma-B regulation protein RsbU (phosphoserine phosphatase)